MKNNIVRIVVVFCCLILLVCPLFTFGVSAYNLPTGNGFFCYFTNPDNVSYSSITLYNWDLEFADITPSTGYTFNPSSVVMLSTENGVQYIDCFLGKFPVEITNFDDGVYLMVSVFEVASDVGAYMTINSGLTNFASGTAEFMGDPAHFNIIGINTNILYFDVHQLSNYADLPVHYTLVLWDLDVSLNGGSSGTCPTLQEQLNSYNGTWDEFRGMLDQAEINGNSTLNEGLIAELNEYREVGEITVKSELNSKTTFQQFIDQLTEYDMTNAIDVLNNRVRNVFNDGIDIGYAQGLKVGDEQGYNRGTSENFGQNLLGDTFNAPLNALNQWVLFETPGGIEVTMGGLFTAVIALAVLVIFLKMFAGG